MDAQAALRMLLFQKALKLSVAARTSTGVGAIVNLTANDADRISEMTYGVNLLWNAPLEVTSCSPPCCLLPLTSLTLSMPLTLCCKAHAMHSAPRASI